MCNNERIAALKSCGGGAKNSVSCIACGGHGFIRHTLKLQRKTNGALTTLHSSKVLIKQFVQLARQSSSHWQKKRSNAIFRSQDLEGPHTDIVYMHINIMDVSFPF